MNHTYICVLNKYSLYCLVFYCIYILLSVDGEVFKLKKSNYSRRLAKQRERERKKKEETLAPNKEVSEKKPVQNFENKAESKSTVWLHANQVKSKGTLFQLKIPQNFGSCRGSY